MLYDDVDEEIADATYNVVAKAKEKKEAEGKKKYIDMVPNKAWDHVFRQTRTHVLLDLNEW